MFVKLLFMILFLTSSLFANELFKFEEDPFTVAMKEISEKKFQTNLSKAIKSYEDGLYSKSVSVLNDVLKTKISTKEKSIIYLMLAANFYKLKDENSMIGLLNSVDTIFTEDRYTIYRIYQIASLLFTERKNQEGINLILRDIYKPGGKTHQDLDSLLKAVQKESIFKVYSQNPQLLYKGMAFEMNKNIFMFDPTSMVFGDLFIYRVEKDTTLLELSKTLGFGYYELKNANPYVDPFDVRKDQLIILPYKRIFPFDKFEYGTIYINIIEKRLYYPVMIDGKSYIITFPIGIGTDEAQSPVGEFKITEKRKDPAWYPPESIRKEQPDLPKVFPPGPDNPLGTRAMRLGNTAFLIHGTNKEYGIGMKVSHGCIRMYNRDVEKLFEVVDIGTKVVSGEIYVKRFNGEVEVFDDGGLKYLTGLSKLFMSLYRTDILGKSFAIKPF